MGSVALSRDLLAEQLIHGSSGYSRSTKTKHNKNCSAKMIRSPYRVPLSTPRATVPQLLRERLEQWRSNDTANDESTAPM